MLGVLYIDFKTNINTICGVQNYMKSWFHLENIIIRYNEKGGI